jgi:hypothetical protein
MQQVWGLHGFKYLSKTLDFCRELVVSASRKSIDDHIVLMGWYPEESGDVLYSVEVGKDVWLPRIELQGFNHNDQSRHHLEVYSYNY